MKKFILVILFITSFTASAAISDVCSEYSLMLFQPQNPTTFLTNSFLLKTQNRCEYRKDYSSYLWHLPTVRLDFSESFGTRGRYWLPRDKDPIVAEYFFYFYKAKSDAPKQPSWLSDESFDVINTSSHYTYYSPTRRGYERRAYEAKYKKLPFNYTSNVTIMSEATEVFELNPLQAEVFKRVITESNEILHGN